MHAVQLLNMDQNTTLVNQGVVLQYKSLLVFTSRTEDQIFRRDRTIK